MELLNILHETMPILWSALGLLIVILYGKRLYNDLIFTPLAGGNGKVQMDEMAKAIILIVFIYCVRTDATRATEYHVFSDTFYFALLLSVCAIASIKPLFENMTQFKRDKIDDEKVR